MSRNRVLIVEDEEVVAADLQARLRRMGYEIAALAASGEAAVAAARGMRPDIVLMDIALAGAMDGIQAASQIREEMDIPVIFLTAHSDSHTLKRAIEAEPHAYIVKPFDEANLRVALELVPYRHAMERRLKTINRWFAAALLNVGDAVIATNNNGEILFMNPPAEKLTGWPLREAAGRPCSEVVRLVQASSGAPLRDPGETALREGTMLHLTDETVLLSRDGTQAHVDDCSTPIYDGVGRVIGAVVVFTETSKRKEAAASIAQLNERLRTLSDQTAAHAAEREHVEAMIASISHDMRAPLSIIIGFTEMLVENYAGSLDTDGQRSLEIIRVSARRLTGMLDDYLNFLKTTRSEIRSSVPIEMTALARTAFDEAATQAPGGRRPEFICPVLPAAVADAGMLRQVFANLLSNAVKYSSRQGHPIVEVGGRQEGEQNIYWVKDNGAGFDPNLAENLFQPFRRLHLDHEYPGTGIGLATVKRIVEKHRGRVWAESQSGRGATFYFSLPAAEPMKA